MAKKIKAILLSDDNVNMLVHVFPSGNREFKSFTVSEIMEISIKDAVMGALFKKPTQIIEILTQNPETPSYYNPVLFYKHVEKEFFDEYISELRAWASKKNKRITDNRTSQ